MTQTISENFSAAPSADVSLPWFSQVMANRGNLFQYLLLLRFMLINMVGLALVGMAWMQGWLDKVVVADTTGLTALICGVFVVGLGVCGHRVMQTSRELNQLASPIITSDGRVGQYLNSIKGKDSQGRSLLATALQLKLASRIGAVKHIANSLVIMGLVGTVIGFIFALSGVDPESAGDVTAIAPMVSTLIQGMSIALYTTLVGSILNIWLMFNFRILESGSVHLLTHLVEKGERDAGV